jgi:hypothetical protein
MQNATALTELTHAQLVAKLTAIEEIVFNLHLDITTNEDYENMSEATELAVTKINNELYNAIYNKDLI